MGEPRPKRTPKVQVRLDEDVAEVLVRAADRSDRSVSAEANQWLRRVLGAPPMPGAGGGRASVVAAGTRCKHPPGRRIGNACAACGKRF
jgi:hypothetical protein